MATNDDTGKISGPEVFRKILREMRKAWDMTLREFADLFGISHTHLIRLESGEIEPQRKYILRAAEVLGFDTDVLLACAGMVRDEYANPIRFYPNLFVTLFQLLMHENTSSDLAKELDAFVSRQRKRHHIGCGAPSISRSEAAALYTAIGKKLRETGRKLMETPGESGQEV